MYILISSIFSLQLNLKLFVVVLNFLTTDFVYMFFFLFFLFIYFCNLDFYVPVFRWDVVLFGTLWCLSLRLRISVSIFISLSNIMLKLTVNNFFVVTLDHIAILMHFNNRDPSLFKGHKSKFCRPSPAMVTFAYEIHYYFKDSNWIPCPYKMHMCKWHWSIV